LLENDGGVKIVSRKAVGNISFPSLPEGLITRPTLVWLLDAANAGKQKTEVGYLTGGMQWHAEYVALVNDSESQLELGTWVSIDNQTGASYENAVLKLVAGEVQREQHIPVRALAKMEMAADAPQAFSEKSFFEYHLYTLERRATVANNQVKQIALFPPAQVKVAKKYTFEPSRDNGIRVNLEFENRKTNGLGIPLPAGKIRAYKKDSDGAMVFIGEDGIEHTPKDEKVDIHVGNAFDLVAERIQKDRQSIGQRSWEETWETKLRNHKDEPASVTVVERFGVNWKIVSSSHEFRQKDAQTVEFVVPIPKDGETVVDFTVRYSN